MKRLTKSILVLGKRKQCRGLSSDGRQIFFDNSKLVMFPVVRYGGRPLEPMPSIAPKEIRRFSARPPDLTGRYPEVVKRLYDQRQQYQSSLTYEQFKRDSPPDADHIDEAQFEVANRTMLAESLEDFAKTSRARLGVWRERRTPKEAKRVGYQSGAIGIALEQWIRNSRHPEMPSWGAVYDLKYVAIYPDRARTKIYLSDLIEQPIPDEIAAVEVVQRLEALEKQRTRRQLRQASKGGASTFKFKEHPEAYEFFLKKLKEFYRRYGNAAKAIREAKSLLKDRYPTAPCVSDNTCRNILQGKTGSIMRGSSNRV